MKKNNVYRLSKNYCIAELTPEEASVAAVSRSVAEAARSLLPGRGLGTLFLRRGLRGGERIVELAAIADFPEDVVGLPRGVLDEMDFDLAETSYVVLANELSITRRMDIA